LLYPQFTQGKSIKVAEGSEFVRPFTQQIGAGPMIRLRIGNLIASNYSRFNLARIFGADSAGSVINSKTLAAGQNTEIKLLEPTRPSKGDRYIPVSNKNYISKKSPAKGPNWFNPAKYPGAFVMKIIDVDGGSLNCTIEFEARIDGPTKTLYRYGQDLAKGIVTDVRDQQFIVAFTELLTPDEDTAKKIASRKAEPSVSEYGAAVTDFVDPEKNTIAKSFRSAGGKGLAGFIESLSYDWYNGVTWDVEYGRKAPKMCKINVSFAPVHDIAPGLDSRGYNRAPVYPVGVDSRIYSV
jgi:hypothetical protein